MAKGAHSKELVTQKLLEAFEGAFKYDKEIRIPMIEDGAEVQIKVTLTCAKENVENPNMNFGGASQSGGEIANAAQSTSDPVQITPTIEEKENVKKILASLNF